jgi:hypothetical protein
LRRLEICGHPGRDDARGLVDLQIDKTRENKRFARRGGVVFDFREHVIFDREPAGAGAVDRVDEKSL